LTKLRTQWKNLGDGGKGVLRLTYENALGILVHRGGFKRAQRRISLIYD
jgi:hypothetical protein